MNSTPHEFDSLFRLKPTRAAKVSEISEATAASSIPVEDRVNFHIGNPVQDERLSSAYLRAAAGLDIRDETDSSGNLGDLLARLEWPAEDLPALELLSSLVRKSGPYLPRGGYARGVPSPIVKAFSEWLQQQPEPLLYDSGTSSGQREIILASGGITEALRVLFHALSVYLTHRPARILCHRLSLPDHCTSFRDLEFHSLPDEERLAVEEVSILAGRQPLSPAFLVLGTILTEEARRRLRRISLTAPLFFIEANDAPNHFSLGREAGLTHRVIRFLTPAIFSPRYARLSLMFVAGNPEYLALLETLHFQLKGTPSASEAELLNYLLRVRKSDQTETTTPLPVDPPMEPRAFGLEAETTFSRYASTAGSVAERVLDRHADRVSVTTATLAARGEEIVNGVLARAPFPRTDRFADTGAATMVRQLADNVHDAGWIEDLQGSLLGAFIRHHPEYQRAACCVVSGSSRTALSLLGFHCGIREVVVPDLSWTYEHCFPAVHAVPLDGTLGLDTASILQSVEARMNADSDWPQYGAVVLNNPHNASGRIFDPQAVRGLLRRLLERGILVIDDLSYQNVAPVAGLPEIPTLRQLADELVRSGSVTSEQAGRVVTVHSMSKTDCLAGARMSIVEIRDPYLGERFRRINGSIGPNLGAILLSYLFYRNSLEVTRAYWRLRNTLLYDRMQALETALRNLPADRNPFGIRILPPTGSMYPLMIIDGLPAGLSLDWVGSGLARQGIGMVPLTTFARTEKGFETGRKAFRLTLGGSDPASVLLSKTRRVLIDLNHVVDEEAARYRRSTFTVTRPQAIPESTRALWTTIEAELRARVAGRAASSRSVLPEELADQSSQKLLVDQFLPDRLSVYRQRFHDRAFMTQELMNAARADRGKQLSTLLEAEFTKDSLERRRNAFRDRLFDRTVHPTQLFSIRSEACFDSLLHSAIRGSDPSPEALSATAESVIAEFLGVNVSISSTDEADEVILDLDALIATEIFGEIQGARFRKAFLSFWGDWDGSNRPSGQGHRLVASVLLHNVRRMAHLLRLLSRADAKVQIDPGLRADMDRLEGRTLHLVTLMNQITALTHQLERRYRGILPFHATPGPFRRIGMSLHLARDPVTSLWYHNDRLERRMLELRRKRREAFEYYFSLNKRLRKELRRLLPALQHTYGDQNLLRETVLYRDLLQRFVLTPRVQEGMITAQDAFAIDTTVFNITEINEIAARYGNPGMVLAFQISMSTKPHALVELDRKFRAQRDHVLRGGSGLDIPAVWLIPLFEDIDAVRGLEGYLDRLWEYSLQSRRLKQETADRFAELVAEVFIAGSDLSQQVGQAAGAFFFRKAKYTLMDWLARHGLAHRVRLKMGSGEPMQRQGGYYTRVSGVPAFIDTRGADLRFAAHLRESTRRSTRYATTPMLGVFSGGDLRTFQSALAERVRHLPVEEYAQLLHHIGHHQRRHLRDLHRACEEYSESRFKNTVRGKQSLERLTLGAAAETLESFLELLTQNFRQILYGRDEDVVGLHIVSYFIARTTPALRDRPTVRPGQGGKERGDRILERIAATIPFSRYGSLLRAIAHNQAQTAVLGVNQLTTGLFRALDAFSRQQSSGGDPETFLADRILPHLPVYEILQSLRLYHDVELEYLQSMEQAFPAGNSAFLALREDLDAMQKYIPLLQQEVLRRHGVEVDDFFEEARFIPDLLPTLRPDLAVLLQPDLFNTDPDRFRETIGGPIDRHWLEAVTPLLSAPREIRHWRSRAWSLLERPVVDRVHSFVELAVSLYSISSRTQARDLPAATREVRLSPGLTSFFRMARADDEMRGFLAAAVEYLSAASEGMVEVPANIIRAMREVEKVATIEEQALTPAEQSRLRFYLQQIARIAGENG